jgi:hypothetical protein
MKKILLSSLLLSSMALLHAAEGPEYTLRDLETMEPSTLIRHIVAIASNQSQGTIVSWPFPGLQQLTLASKEGTFTISRQHHDRQSTSSIFVSDPQTKVCGNRLTDIRSFTLPNAQEISDKISEMTCSQDKRAAMVQIIHGLTPGHIVSNPQGRRRIVIIEQCQETRIK